MFYIINIIPLLPVRGLKLAKQEQLPLPQLVHRAEAVKLLLRLLAGKLTSSIRHKVEDATVDRLDLMEEDTMVLTSEADQDKRLEPHMVVLLLDLDGLTMVEETKLRCITKHYTRHLRLCTCLVTYLLKPVR